MAFGLLYSGNPDMDCVVYVRSGIRIPHPTRKGKRNGSLVWLSTNQRQGNILFLVSNSSRHLIQQVDGLLLGTYLCSTRLVTLCMDRHRLIVAYVYRHSIVERRERGTHYITLISRPQKVDSLAGRLFSSVDSLLLISCLCPRSPSPWIIDGTSGAGG